MPRDSTLTFYGKFALIGSTRPDPPSYLERCGTTLHMRLPPAAAIFGNSHELLQYPTSNHLDGITLPSLKHFQVAFPTRFVREGTGFALSSHHLYADENNGMLWTASLPLPPQPN